MPLKVQAFYTYGIMAGNAISLILAAYVYSEISICIS